MGSEPYNTEGGAGDTSGQLSMSKAVLIAAVVLVVALGAGIGIGFVIGKEEYECDSPPPSTEVPSATTTTTAAPVPVPGAPNVLLTEFLQDGDNKAVEISNMGTSAVDFAETPMSVAVYAAAAGGARAAQPLETAVASVQLEGVLPAGAALVVISATSSAALKETVQAAARVVVVADAGFSSRGPLVLLQGAGRVDMIGAFGMANKIENVVLRRAAGNTTPNPSGFATAAGSGFVQLPRNDYSGFGCSGPDACDTPVPMTTTEAATTTTTTTTTEATTTTTEGPVGEAKVLLTEYLEDGNNKAIEVSNVGSAAVDFAQTPMTIELYRNGDATRGTTVATLSGVLAAGEAKVFAYTKVEDAFKALPALEGRLELVGKLDFNGDDPLALLQGAERVDMIGAFGMTNKIENVVLRRAAGNTTPNPSGFATAAGSGFVQLPRDDFSGFGCSGPDACGGATTTTAAPGATTTTGAPEVEVGSCGDGKETRVHAVQGASWSSPVKGQVVVIEGVYTGANADGFFVQEEAAHVDDDSKTSEGIHVKTAAVPDAEAMPMHSVVRVMGMVDEVFGMTTLVAQGAPVVCGKGAEPEAVSVDTTDAEGMEAAEGMVVAVANKLVVSNTFSTWRYGEVEVAPSVLMQESAVEVPGTPAHEALVKANKAHVFVVEDSSSAQYPKTLSWYPYVPISERPINIGASISGIVGPLHYAWGKWRTSPVKQVELGNNRPSADSCVADVPGVDRTAPLAVASFNVLNYFNGQPDGKGGVTFSFKENRGAKSALQFEIQSAKIVNALFVMDADVVGLMEIENDGFDEASALATIVKQLNARWADSAKHYSFVRLDEGRVGTDAITNGLIYRAAKVAPVGAAWTVAMPRQRYVKDGETTTKQMRPALVQTFRELRTGEEVTVSVNHFKSKGSTCYEDESPEWPAGGVVKLQGSCNGLRVKAAQMLGEAMRSARVAKRVLLLGDFNSYAKEDPIAVLTDYDPSTHPYKIQTAVKLIERDDEAEGTTEAEEVSESFGYKDLAPEGYSYVFRGRAGSLDYVLGNEVVAKEVTSAVHWSINANELYQMTYFQAWQHYPGYVDESVYRSSDHDPVLVTLNMQAA